MKSESGTCSWHGFVNARSLAGIRVRRGVIGPACLFRSDEPEGTPETVAAALATAGVATVIDLRSETEITRRPAVHRDLSGYVVAPLVDPRTDHLRDVTAERSLADLYRGSLARNGRTIAAVVRTIIDAPSGGVLVHCAAGKDRTGILVAVILDALGAHEQDIVNDYAATEPNLAPYFAEELAAIDDPALRERVAARQHATPETMHELLADLHATYGGGAAYLIRNRLTDADLDALHTRLTASVLQ